MVNQDTRGRIEREETLWAIQEMERRLEGNGRAPLASGLPLRRNRAALERAGGVALGVLISGLAALSNFVIFNWVLHVGH